MPASPISTAKKIRDKFRHGLVRLTIRHYIWKTGIHYSPYYWMSKTIPGQTSDAYPENPEGFVFSEVSQANMETLLCDPELSEAMEDNIRKHFKDGNRCIVARYKGRIAGLAFFNLGRSTSSLHPVTLKPNEAYLCQRYVLSEYRGRGLASLLHHQCCEQLRSLGKDTLYSLVIAFNTPAIRNSNKLGKKILFKGLHINLFNRWQRNWVLKTYDVPAN